MIRLGSYLSLWMRLDTNNPFCRSEWQCVTRLPVNCLFIFCQPLLFWSVEPQNKPLFSPQTPAGLTWTSCAPGLVTKFYKSIGVICSLVSNGQNCWYYGWYVWSPVLCYIQVFNAVTSLIQIYCQLVQCCVLIFYISLINAFVSKLNSLAR